MRKICLALSLLLLLVAATPRQVYAEEQVGETDEWSEATPTDGAALPDEEAEPPSPESESTPQLPEEESEAEAPDLLPPPSAMPPARLASGETVVYTHAQLKAALGEDNQIHTVYLGDDIVMLGGIDIHPSKATVIVDGVNPLTPENPIPHTLTDQSSTAQAAAIRINSADTKQLLVRNLTIVGQNYFGTFTVSELYGAPEAVITYERVDYNGPQIGFHRRGTIVFKDCSIRIHGENDGPLSQEAAEVKHLRFEGDNTITTVSVGYSTFWLPTGGSLDVLDDSSLSIISQNTSAAYGIVYCGGTLNPLRVTVGSRAVLDVTLSDLFAPAPGCQLNDLTVREGGEFRLTSTRSPTAAVLTTKGAFTLERDAKFVFLGTASSLFAALRQEKGDIIIGAGALFHMTAAAAYPTLINLVGTGLVSHDAASVLLKSDARPIRAEGTAGGLNLSAQQVNYRTVRTETPQSVPPNYKWEQPDGSAFTLSAAIAVGDIVNLTSITSNYAAPNPPGVPPTVSNFSMVSARILAWGRLEASLTAVKAGTTTVGGVTASGALVQIFTRSALGEDTFLAETTADHWGVFHVSVSDALVSGTTVVAKVFWNYLSAQATATVTDEGRLELFAPDTLDFTTTPVSLSPAMIGRAERDWHLTVADTRGGGAGWRLYVGITGDLTPADEKYPPLPGAMVYVHASGEVSTIPLYAQTQIASHVTGAEEDAYTLSWPENRGPMLRLVPLDVCSNMRYSTQVIWTLIDGP